MQGCNPTPTNADKLRFVRIQHFGCIACRMMGYIGTACEIHHIQQGDHQNTIGLCCWHHRGVQADGWSAQQMRDWFGPSLALSKRAFEEFYGTQEELLRFTNRRALK